MILFEKSIIFSFILFFSTSSSAQLKPGDVHPNAKVLDVDKLYPFSDGVARVQKGVLFALINASGNYVIPFNEYTILTDSKSKLLVISEKSNGTKYGLLNSSVRDD